MEFLVQAKKSFAFTGGKPFDAMRPTVVFIHGAQHDHSVWILQSRYLAHHGFSVLALDLPGHGKSAGPALADIEAMAAWVLDALAAVGASDVTLVGHSMGSLIALEAAAREDSRICRIALLATAYPMRVSETLLAAAQHDEVLAIDMINIWSHSQREGGFSHKPSNPGPGFSIVWCNQRLMQRQAAGVLYTDFAACNAYAGGAAAAGRVNLPVLFLLGEKDAMTPPGSGIALAQQFAQRTLTVLPGVGHAMMSEAPGEVLDALRSFLAHKAPI